MNFFTKILPLILSLGLIGCMSGESVSLAPVQQGSAGGGSLDSVAQAPGQVGSPLGGDANSATGGPGGGSPGGQPTEDAHIAPKLITLNGEVCFAREGEPDCESDLSGTLLFQAWEGSPGDWRPENPPLAVNTDGTFAHLTSYYFKQGECQVFVRYEATYTVGFSTYYAELERETCPPEGKEIPLRVLLQAPLQHIDLEELEGWVGR